MSADDATETQAHDDLVEVQTIAMDEALADISPGALAAYGQTVILQFKALGMPAPDDILGLLFTYILEKVDKPDPAQVGTVAHAMVKLMVAGHEFTAQRSGDPT